MNKQIGSVLTDKAVDDIVNLHHGTQVTNLVCLDSKTPIGKILPVGYYETTKFKDIPEGEKNILLIDPSEKELSSKQLYKLLDEQSDMEYLFVVMRDVESKYTEQALQFFAYARREYILHKVERIVTRKQTSDKDYDHDMQIYMLKRDKRARLGFYIERSLSTVLKAPLYSHEEKSILVDNCKAFNWSGYLMIEHEKIHYAHRTNNKFVQITRGSRHTNVVDHPVGAIVYKMGRQVAYPKMPILINGFVENTFNG